MIWGLADINSNRSYHIKHLESFQRKCLSWLCSAGGCVCQGFYAHVGGVKVWSRGGIRWASVNMLFLPRHTRGFDVLSSEMLSGSIRLWKIICILLWVAVRTGVRCVCGCSAINLGDFDPYLQQQKHQTRNSLLSAWKDSMKRLLCVLETIIQRRDTHYHSKVLGQFLRFFMILKEV